MINKLLILPLKTIITLCLGLFWMGLWFYALGMLAWYPMRWWPGDSFYPVQLLNYFKPWLLITLIPALFLAAIAGRFRLATALIIPTSLIAFSYAPLFLPRTNVVLAEEQYGQDLKVMSYNIWHINRDLPGAVELISQENPTLLLLQETSPDTARWIVDQWTELNPDQSLHLIVDASMQQAIISQFPLTPSGNAFNEGRVQKAIAHTPGGPMQVWNVHASQPVLWRTHLRQMKRLNNSIAATNGPLIVGGDFNTNDQSEVYRLINKHLQNAHWQAGWGFGFSFSANTLTVIRTPVPMSLVRIDHIFYSDHFFAHNARTLSASGGSDHFPIVAEFSMINEQRPG